MVTAKKEPTDEQKTKRCVYLIGNVDEESSEEFIKTLFKLELEGPEKDIVVVIDSYGGYVHSMWGMIDTMNLLSCPIHTLTVGKAMSAGAMVLLNGAKGKRYIAPNASIMLHQLSAGISGTASSLLNEAEEIKRMHKHMCDFIIKNTKIAKNKIAEIMREDFHLNSRQAVEFGVVDRVLTKFGDLKLKGW